MTVVGTGGPGTDAYNHGVYVAGSNAQITSGGAVTVRGFGGASSGTGNVGVYVTGTNCRITSSGGAVLVEGTGGGKLSSTNNHGVSVANRGNHHQRRGRRDRDRAGVRRQHHR